MHNYVKSDLLHSSMGSAYFDFFSAEKTKSGPKSQSLEKQIPLNTLFFFCFCFVLFVCLFVCLFVFCQLQKIILKIPQHSLSFFAKCFRDFFSLPLATSFEYTLPPLWYFDLIHRECRFYVEVFSKIICPFHKMCTPVRLLLPITQKMTKSLKTLLVSHEKTFEMTKQT